MKGNNVTPKWTFIPLSGFIIGGCIPLSFNSSSYEWPTLCGAIYTTVLIFTACSAESMLKKIGKLNPKLGSWAFSTILGSTVTLFTFGLVFTGVPESIVALPEKPSFGAFTGSLLYLAGSLYVGFSADS